jgi:hypothetical protein
MIKTLDPYLGEMWNCTDCAKKDEEKGQIEGFTHACVYCGKIHKTRGALKTPTSLSHRDSKLLF